LERNKYFFACHKSVHISETSMNENYSEHHAMT